MMMMNGAGCFVRFLLSLVYVWCFRSFDYIQWVYSKQKKLYAYFIAIKYRPTTTYIYIYIHTVDTVWSPAPPRLRLVIVLNRYMKLERKKKRVGIHRILFMVIVVGKENRGVSHLDLLLHRRGRSIPLIFVDRIQSLLRNSVLHDRTDDRFLFRFDWRTIWKIFERDTRTSW